MSSSPTPQSPSAAFTQFLRRRHGLRHIVNSSALWSSPPTVSGGLIFRGSISSLSLQPGYLLASCTVRPGSPGPRRLLRSGFRPIGLPLRRRVFLRCQLGNLHRRDFHPLDKQLASLHHNARSYGDIAEQMGVDWWISLRTSAFRVARWSALACRLRCG